MTRTIDTLRKLYETLPAGGCLDLTDEEMKLWTAYRNLGRDISRETEEKQPSIAEVLAERGSRYGDFKEHARITQTIKAAMANSKNFHILVHSQKEALEMIAHKIGRILNGDPNYLDSWIDIVGYTQLVIDELNAQEKAK